jgi:phytol kinase
VNPTLAVAAVLAAVVALVSGARTLQMRYNLHPEWSRKLVHIGSGLVALTFPWLLGSVWPAVTACAVGALGMMALRRSRRFGKDLDDVLGGEARRSWGEVYFPLTVALLFLLAKGDPLLYCIPLLILTLADAAAAVIGLHYGLMYYQTANGRKSTEGSLVFFVVAFFSTHIPLLLFTDIGRVECLLIGLLVALLSMIIEAVGYRGEDNLLTPLLAFMILKASLVRDALELGLEVGIALALFVFVFLLRRRTALSGSALLGTVLVGYLSWTLGGWMWMLAPFILFMTNAVLFNPTRGRQRAQHFNAVFYVSGAGLGWLALARSTGREELMFPFVVAFSVQLAMLSVLHLRARLPELRGSGVVALGAVIGWGLLFAPFALLGAFGAMGLAAASWSLSTAIVAAWWFYRRFTRVLETPGTALPWRQQGLYGAALSLIALVPLYVT